MGPTASGKTDLAVALTECLPCDIISVDSAMIYRGMDIGTAKPDTTTLARAPHRLINLLDPSEPYSAAQFRRDALREMSAITARGRIPLLVGGTMLYFKVLLEGIAELPAADPALRAAVTWEAESIGWPAIHARLAAVDPSMAARLHPNHSQRILRAWEVYCLTGQPMSALQKQQASEPLPWSVTQLALMPARDAVHLRIAQRFDAMLSHGLIDEVRALHARGTLSPDLPAIRSVGYRQVWEFLDGETTANQMHDKAVFATRQLAKRQFTWLRSWPHLHNLPTREPFDIKKVLYIALKLLANIGI